MGDEVILVSRTGLWICHKNNLDFIQYIRNFYRNKDSTNLCMGWVERMERRKNYSYIHEDKSMGTLTQLSLTSGHTGLRFLLAEGRGKSVSIIFIPMTIFWSIIISSQNLLNKGEKVSVELEADP